MTAKAPPKSPPSATKPARKPSTKPLRQRDNRLRNHQGKAAAEVFVEALTRLPNKKGAITQAARTAYPNQSPKAAGITGCRLLKDPSVQEMMRERRRRAAEHADITRQEIKGFLTQMAEASLGDFTDHRGELDWELAKDRGIDHLVSQVTVTERHSEHETKKGKRVTNRRISTTFKLPDKIKALDLIADLDGLKKQAARNPLDGAMECFERMRRNPIYADLPDPIVAQLAQESCNLPASAIPEIMAGAVKG